VASPATSSAIPPCAGRRRKTARIESAQGPRSRSPRRVIPVRSVRRRSCNPLADLLAPVLIIAALLANQGSARAAEDSRKFQLEVFINDAPTKLVGTFSQLADNRFAATRAELTELGVKPPGSGAAEDLVVLDDIPGITYRYDEPAQKMLF